MVCTISSAPLSLRCQFALNLPSAGSGAHGRDCCPCFLRDILNDKYASFEENFMAIDMRGVCPLLQVFDMPTSVRFYRDKLGFEVAEHAPIRDVDEFGWCLLRHGDGTEIMLNTVYDYGERPDSPDLGRIAAHGDTCVYIGCPDVDGAYAFLREKGLDIQEPKMAWYGMKQLYLTDPDGFGICFQWKA
jgi:catechol 2,3-dioxygenase-like lactoylglutathione lyase family enzyme